MPKLPVPSDGSKSTAVKPYAKRTKAAKDKAFLVSTAGTLLLTPPQFTQIAALKSEYIKHKADPEIRLKFLLAAWHEFLEVHTVHNNPPFPEDEEMVEQFHLARAKALGRKLDNIVMFAAGIPQQRPKKA